MEERCGGGAERVRQSAARLRWGSRRCELAKYYRPAAAQWYCPACAPPTAEMLAWPALHCAVASPQRARLMVCLATWRPGGGRLQMLCSYPPTLAL